MNKLIIPLIAIVALLSGFFISSIFAPPKEIHIQSGTWLQQAIPVNNFELIDHNNQAFTQDDLKHKWSILFFGYTNCPDICPDSLHMLKTMVAQLKPEQRKEVQIVFISIDPERDTPKILKEYVTFFNKDFIGATNDIAKVNPLTKQLGILHYIKKIANSYDVAHAANMILINPDGGYNAVFSPPYDAKAMALDMTTIMDNF